MLHDESQASRLLMMTCDTLLFLKNDGTCIDMIVKTENNPYVNDQLSLLGKNIFTYFPEETVRELKPAVEEVIRTGKRSDANYNLPAPDKYYFFKCIIHKYDEEHLLCQYRDITRRSQMKKNLQKANERLTETERAAKIGYWRLDTSSKTFHYSGYVGILIGEAQEISWPFKKYLEYIHPEDRYKIENLLESSDFKLDTFEYRVVKDKIYYLRAKVVNVYADNNGNTIIDGYTQNIDDIISRWNELKMVTLAVNNSNDSIYATKIDGTLIFANHLCRLQNHIPENIDITKFKIYEVFDNFTDKADWDNFVESLRKNDNKLKFVCNHPYPEFNVIGSDCSSFTIHNEYDEEIIWNLRRDISDQLRYQMELKEAKDKAEESDRLKSAFLSNMSHEIRTPLNAIVGFSSVMADIDDPQERKKYNGIIESSNKRLLLLIDEVLDLSKIESGMFQFTLEPVKLNDLFREIFASHQFYGGHSSLQLNLPKKDVTVVTDSNRFTQVMSNLINNAIKFTPNGRIEIGYRLHHNFVECYVDDNGIGIAADKIDRIFDRFVKVDDFAPGSGLGLSICKTIVERLGGDISVLSEPGKGSSFSFRIPARHPKTKVPMVSDKSTSFPKQTIQKRRDVTILVAEDIDDNFELIRVMLKDQYRLLHAKDGLQLIKLFEENSPDLILMDVKIPELDGFEAIKIIRNIASYPVPIIIVSAYAYNEDKDKFLINGCNVFLSKPLKKDVLLSTIQKYV